MSTDGDCLMCRGRSFHSTGAAAAKDLLPKYSNRRRLQKIIIHGSESARRGVRSQQFMYICRCQAIQGLVHEQEDFKVNPLLYGQPVQINKDRGNVVVFAPLSNDTSRMILALLKLRHEILGDAKH